MKKVYQTIVDKDHGNCMQAAIASLFELELNQVPNFVEMPNDKWFLECMQLFRNYGYEICAFNINNHKLTDEEKLYLMEHDGGVNGYWHASVNSLTLPGCTHSVLVDKYLNVVHDPNPNQKALELKPQDILDIYTVKNDWHISSDGKFIIENI